MGSMGAMGMGGVGMAGMMPGMMPGMVPGLPGVVEPPFDFQKQLQELRKVRFNPI